MSRVKPSILWVRDLEHANQVLGEMTEAARKIKEIEMAMNAEIDAAKARGASVAAPIKKRVEAMGNGLNAFAEANRADLFSGGKTKELDFGRFGFRKSTEVTTVAKTTLAMVLERLKSLKFSEAIRIKEEVDKESVREWPEERLALVGMRRVEKDVFWYELKQEELKDG